MTIEMIAITKKTISQIIAMIATTIAPTASVILVKTLGRRLCRKLMIRLHNSDVRINKTRLVFSRNLCCANSSRMA